MKLAAVNPSLDFNIDNLSAKEVRNHHTIYPVSNIAWKHTHALTDFHIFVQIFSAKPSELHALEASSDINVTGNFPSDHLSLVPCCGMEMGVETPNMLLRRTLSAPVSIPEVLIDSPCFNVRSSFYSKISHLLLVSSITSININYFFKLLISQRINLNLHMQQFQPCSTWDPELHSLYAMEFQPTRSSLLSQPCTGL